MDHNVNAASRHVADEEVHHEAACHRVARSHGRTAEQAEACDAGSVGCPDCPFTAAARARFAVMIQRDQELRIQIRDAERERRELNSEAIRMAGIAIGDVVPQLAGAIAVRGIFPDVLEESVAAALERSSRVYLCVSGRGSPLTKEGRPSARERSRPWSIEIKTISVPKAE